MKKRELRAALLAVSIAGALQIPAYAAPHSPLDTLFKQADSADIAEKYQEASAKYLALIKTTKQTDPNNPLRLRAQVRLARLYILQKQFDKGEPVFLAIMNTDHKATIMDPELLIDLDDLSDEYIVTNNLTRPQLNNVTLPVTAQV